MSKRSTVSCKKVQVQMMKFTKKYNINERLIKIIDRDEIKSCQKKYVKKLNELKELRMTPYTKKNEIRS